MPRQRDVAPGVVQVIGTYSACNDGSRSRRVYHAAPPNGERSSTAQNQPQRSAVAASHAGRMINVTTTAAIAITTSARTTAEPMKSFLPSSERENGTFSLRIVGWQSYRRA